MTVTNCPICDKPPKIIRDIRCEKEGFGAKCKIKCKCHLVEMKRNNYETAYNDAVTEWNRQNDLLSRGIVELI